MAEAFRSFREIKAAHDELQRRSGPRASDLASFREAVEAFVTAAAQSGAHIEREDQRRAAADLLEYWNIELLTLGNVEERSFAVPKLLPHGGEGTASAADIKEEERRLRRQLEVSRLAATARQWRDSGHAAGYLLGADALESAEQYVDEDPAIAELVHASQGMEVKLGKRRQRLYLAGIGFLIFTTVAVAMLALWAMQQRNAAEEQRAIAEERTRAATELAAIAVAAKQAADGEADSARAELEKLREANQLASERAGQAATLQSQLDLIRRELNDAVSEGGIAGSALPPALTALLEPELAAPGFVFPPAGSPLLNGHDPDFLGIRVDPPSLPDAVAARTELLPYHNYSLVLDRRERLARFTMSNLDRSQLEILPSAGTPMGFDPRIPPAAQVDPRRLDDPAIAPSQLVSFREISWGAGADLAQARAAPFFEGITNVYTNITPQSVDFNRLIWSVLDEHALRSFNSDALRVTVFSGPVFAADDPIIGGIRIPQAFWKVLVSTRADRKEPELVIEAYLAREDDVPTAGQSTDLGYWRVRLATIEELTGLDFGEPLRTAADGQANFIQQNVLLTPGDSLAVAAQGLADDDDATADAAASELARALAAGETDAASAAQLVDALTTIAKANGPETVGRTLAVLAAVPPENWALPDWIDRRAVTRRLVTEWRTDPALSLVEGGLAAVDQLQPALGLPVVPPGEVYFQFAVMTRDDANAIAAGLQELGWRIPGLEELTRLKEAIGVNEVRHAPEDADAAAELAADLRALGRTQVRPAENSLVPAGTMEIWVSD